MSPTTEDALLRVRDLDIRFGSGAGQTQAVRGVSFDVGVGETVALVGESGSGKTVTARSILRLLAPPGHVHAGRIVFDGRDLLSLSEQDIRRVRGDEIAMVFQEPMTSLNPVHPVGRQIGEVLRLHRGLSRAEAAEEAVRLLREVGISDPQLRAGQYPHTLSGGMRQRVMIAMALACSPKLLIADEPTTALDVTVAAQILALVRELTARSRTSVLLITHDLGVVAELADRVLVMRTGTIVESGPTAQVLADPQHPYTRGLLAALPSRATGRRLGGATATPVARPAVEPDPDGQPLLRVRDLVKTFDNRRSLLRRGRGTVHAVRGVSFDIAAGTTLGLVGESGSGKSTTGRLVTRLLEPTSGSVVFAGTDLLALRGNALREARSGFQTIFQDPYGSLDPRHDVGAAIVEPLTAHGAGTRAQRRERVAELLELVGLTPEFADRLPHQLSGGQRQRVAIARALSVRPRLVVCDEPVSSLDVSIQAQVINLLMDLQDRFGLAYLFVSHDLAVVRHMSDEIAVMYLGRVVERGSADEVYHRPRHPYTRALLASMPGQRRADAAPAQGEIPSAAHIPAGCAFASRCPFVQARCRAEEPVLRAGADGHLVACHLTDELPEHTTSGQAASGHATSSLSGTVAAR
jgi:peptide/nickel transport system ATP-binding protein